MRATEIRKRMAAEENWEDLVQACLKSDKGNKGC